MDVRQLVSLSSYAYELHEDLNVFLPLLTPEKLIDLCDRAAFAVSALTSIEGFDAKAVRHKCQYLNKVGARGSTELPPDGRDRLLWWGRFLDKATGPMDVRREPIKSFLKSAVSRTRGAGTAWSGTRFWETYAAKIGDSRGRMPDAKARQRLWQAPLLRDFLIQSRRITRDVLHFMFFELGAVDTAEWPYAWIPMLEWLLAEFRSTFLGSAAANGPYVPSIDNPVHPIRIPIPEDDLRECVEKSPLGSEPGMLTMEACTGNQTPHATRCEFHSHDGQTTEWYLPSPEGFVASSLAQHLDSVLSVWSYSSGEFIGPHKIQGSAHWLVRDTTHLRQSAATFWKYRVLLQPAPDRLRALADRTYEAVMGGLPEWRPGNVGWGYLKELDAVIQELKFVREVFVREETAEGARGAERLAMITLSDRERAKKKDSIPSFTDTEWHIIRTLGKNTLTAGQIAHNAGYDRNTHLRTVLAGLRKRGILGNKAPGYFLQPDHHRLLEFPDQCHD